MSKDFGEQVRKARLAEGLSQTELADKIGVSQGAVSNWELGTTEPRPAQLHGLEAVLGKFGVSQGSAPGPEEISGAGGAFGAWLRKARTEADMSVPELASAANVSGMAIYNLESGKSLNPREVTKERLSKALKKEVPTDVKEEAAAEQVILGLGSLQDFDPHSKNDRPSAAGVYVFYDVSDRPVYVGKAANIARRVADHEDAFWFRYPIVSNAAFVEIHDETLRHQVEQVLIKFLKSNAVINKQSVVR